MGYKSKVTDNSICLIYENWSNLTNKALWTVDKIRRVLYCQLKQKEVFPFHTLCVLFKRIKQSIITQINVYLGYYFDLQYGKFMKKIFYVYENKFYELKQISINFVRF